MINVVSIISRFPNRLELVSGSRDGTIRIWDLNFPDAQRVIEGHRGMITSVAVSADGSLFASKSCDDTVRIWRYDHGSCVCTIPEKGSQLWSISLAFHPTDCRLATLGENNDVIRIWKLDGEKLANATSEKGGKIRRLVFISYSHKDCGWLDRLTTMLKPLVRNESICAWVDTQFGGTEKPTE